MSWQRHGYSWPLESTCNSENLKLQGLWAAACQCSVWSLKWFVIKREAAATHSRAPTKLPQPVGLEGDYAIDTELNLGNWKESQSSDSKAHQIMAQFRRCSHVPHRLWDGTHMRIVHRCFASRRGPILEQKFTTASLERLLRMQLGS